MKAITIEYRQGKSLVYVHAVLLPMCIGGFLKDIVNFSSDTFQCLLQRGNSSIMGAAGKKLSVMFKDNLKDLRKAGGFSRSWMKNAV